LSQCALQVRSTATGNVSRKSEALNQARHGAPGLTAPTDFSFAQSQVPDS